MKKRKNMWEICFKMVGCKGVHCVIVRNTVHTFQVQMFFISIYLISSLYEVSCVSLISMCRKLCCLEGSELWKVEKKVEEELKGCQSLETPFPFNSVLLILRVNRRDQGNKGSRKVSFGVHYMS